MSRSYEGTSSRIRETFRRIQEDGAPLRIAVRPCHALLLNVELTGSSDRLLEAASLEGTVSCESAFERDLPSLNVSIDRHRQHGRARHRAFSFALQQLLFARSSCPLCHQWVQNIFDNFNKIYPHPDNSFRNAAVGERLASISPFERC